MIGYKGFDSELKCIGYQYEIGKTFEIDSNKELTLCPINTDKEAGLHFCKSPLNVLNYYPNEKGNRYAVVESIGKTIFDCIDSIVATDKLKIIKEITYSELGQLGVEYNFENDYAISNEQFELCSNELKHKYISMRIENDYDISDEMFEWCSDELKEKYISMCIEINCDISDIQFEWCSNELKQKYIKRRIENYWYISDKEFEWCLDELKSNYISMRIEKSWYISYKMKDWYQNFKNK
jgi:hypothetical protein